MKVDMCDKCGKPLMDHASYSNGFIEVLFETPNPPTRTELSEKALVEVQRIIARDLGLAKDGGVTINGVLSKAETEDRLADLGGCPEDED